MQQVLLFKIDKIYFVVLAPSVVMLRNIIQLCGICLFCDCFRSHQECLQLVYMQVLGPSQRSWYSGSSLHWMNGMEFCWVTFSDTGDRPVWSLLSNQYKNWTLKLLQMHLVQQLYQEYLHYWVSLGILPSHKIAFKTCTAIRVGKCINSCTINAQQKFNNPWKFTVFYI